MANTDLLNYFSVNPTLIDKGGAVIEAALQLTQDEMDSSTKWSLLGKENSALTLLKKLVIYKLQYCHISWLTETPH